MSTETAAAAAAFGCNLVMVKLVRRKQEEIQFHSDCFSLERKLRRRKETKCLVGRQGMNGHLGGILICCLYSLVVICLVLTRAIRGQYNFHSNFNPPRPVFPSQTNFNQRPPWHWGGSFSPPPVINLNRQQQQQQPNRMAPSPINPVSFHHHQRQLFARNLNLANDQGKQQHLQQYSNLNNKQFLAERRNSFGSTNVPQPPQQQHHHQQSSRPEDRNSQQQLPPNNASQNPQGRMLICYYTTRQAAPYWPKDTRESFVVPENHILGKNFPSGAPSMARFVATTADNSTAPAGDDVQLQRQGGKSTNSTKQHQQQPQFSPIINYEPFVSFDHQNDLAKHGAKTQNGNTASTNPQIELEFSSAPASGDPLPYSNGKSPPHSKLFHFQQQQQQPSYPKGDHLKSAPSLVNQNLIGQANSIVVATAGEQTRKFSTDSANQYENINNNDNLVATNLVSDNNQSVGFVPTVLQTKNKFATTGQQRDEMDHHNQQQHPQQKHQRPSKLQMVAFAVPVANSKLAHGFQQHQHKTSSANTADDNKNQFNLNKNNRVDYQQENKIHVNFQAPSAPTSTEKQQSIFSPSMSRAFIVNSNAGGGGGGTTTPKSSATATTNPTMNNDQTETKSHLFVDLSPSQTTTATNASLVGGPHLQFLRHPSSTATTPLMPIGVPPLSGLNPSSPTLANQQRAKSLQTAESELSPSIPMLSSSNPTTLTPTTTGAINSIRILAPMIVTKPAPAQATLPSTSYAYRNLHHHHQLQSTASLIGGDESPLGASSSTAATTDSALEQQQQQRNSVRFASSTSSVVRFPSSADSDTNDNNKSGASDQLRLSSAAAAATTTTAATTALTNNNHANNRQHNHAIQSPSSQLVSSALVSSPLSTMFDVFGAASHYLMRFKPSSLISPTSSFAAFNSLANHDHSHHQVGENPHKNANSTLATSSSSSSPLSNSLISLNPFSSGLLASVGVGGGKSAAGQSQLQQSANDRMSSGANSIPSSPSNNFMSRLNLQTNQRREEICGRTIQTPERRIIGGEGARYGEFPYQVHIKIAKHQCGGALVDKQSIVTAAHCVYHFITRAPVSKLQIVIGAYDIEDEQYQELPPQYFKVNKVKLHPNFRFSASHPDRYDIAILKLDKPVKYTDNVLPVCLPNSRDLKFESMVGTVTGFGKTDPSLSNRYGTRLLQKVDVPIIENNECERWHRTRGIDLKIFPEMMCAGYEDGLKDACVGDSGGPLVVKTAINNSNGSFRWTLAGITSAGFGCAQSRQPGIYHRVSHTVDWILENLD